MYLGFVEDKEFGKVLIYTRRGMRRVKAEWKCGVLIMHVGAGMPLNEIMFHIENMRPRLAQLRTTAEADTLHYYDGQEIKCFRHTIKISADLLRESYAKYGSHPDGTLYVAVPAGSDFMRSGVTATISACLKRLMSTRAEQELIPFAQAVASEKGLKPRGFVVGRGMRATRGTAGRIFSALAHSKINVKMIDQGSSELNIIVGVDNLRVKTLRKRF